MESEKRGPIRNLEGMVFGKLIVRGVSRHNGTHWLWLCDCECGGTCESTSGNLKKKNRTPNCGCTARAATGKRSRTHGRSRTRQYQQWVNMKQRCCNENNPAFGDYGGRGIKVCQRWISSFESFLEDMGECPPKETIDRIDPNGNYSCGKCQECMANNWKPNCQWKPAPDQNRNKRNSNLFTINGETKTLAQWCRQFGAKPGSVWNRIFQKRMSLEDAIAVVSRPREKEITVDGVTKKIREWSKITGVPANTIAERIRNGWRPEEAISTELYSIKQGQRGAAKYSLGGKEMLLSAISVELGKSQSYFYVMKARGCDVQELIDQLDRERKQAV